MRPDGEEEYARVQRLYDLKIGQGVSEVRVLQLVSRNILIEAMGKVVSLGYRPNIDGLFRPSRLNAVLSERDATLCNRVSSRKPVRSSETDCSIANQGHIVLGCYRTQVAPRWFH